MWAIDPYTLKPSLTCPKHAPESPQAAPFVPGGLGGSSSSSSSLRPATSSTGDGLLNTQAAPFKPGGGSAGAGGTGRASSGYYAGGDEGMGYDDGEGEEDGGWWAKDGLLWLGVESARHRAVAHTRAFNRKP